MSTPNRLEAAFAKASSENRSALIPFIMGGDPDIDISNNILGALPAHGADIIEIGVPFSDPMADGPVIQAAGLRALTSGATLKAVLAQVHQFRANNQETPIILMGYANPFVQYGLEAFANDAHDAGVDGVIIVDVPAEEAAPFIHALNTQSLEMVQLIAPPSLRDRLPLLTEHASGYLYLIAVAGITGGEGANAETIKDYMQQIKKHTALPVAVGFGIKTAEDVRALNGVAEGIVVGSAIVKHIENAKQDGGKAALELVQSLADALR